MNMNKWLIFCFVLPIALQVRGQGYTLEECQQKAQANYPQVRQLALIEQTGEYNLSNASKGYLPQFSLSAKATYQTQVIEFPDIPIPGLVLPKQNNDQYQAAVQLNQVLWDGGQIGAAKEGIRSATEVQKQQYQVDMYALRSRVNDLFFAILLLDGQIDVNRTNLATLGRNYADVESYKQNGVANQADVDAIHVEQLALQQANIQLATAREAYGRVLFTFLGEAYRDDFSLVTPPLTGAPALGSDTAGSGERASRRAELAFGLPPSRLGHSSKLDGARLGVGSQALAVPFSAPATTAAPSPRNCAPENNHTSLSMSPCGSIRSASTA